MNKHNEEGTAEPVAVVGKGISGGVGVTYLPALYSLPHGTKLYTAPPAVLPAAPSDAVIEILALVRSYGDARQDGNDNRAAGWIRDITAALQAPQAEPAAGEQAGAVALVHQLGEALDFYVSQAHTAKGAAAIEAYHAFLAAPGAAIAARETNATIIYGALSDQARQRTSRENIEDVLAALASRDEAPATPQAETASTKDADDEWREIVRKHTIGGAFNIRNAAMEFADMRVRAAIKGARP